MVRLPTSGRPRNTRTWRSPMFPASAAMGRDCAGARNETRGRSERREREGRRTVGREGTSRIDRSIDRSDEGVGAEVQGVGRTGGRGGVERDVAERRSACERVYRNCGWGTREVRRLASWRARTLTRRGRPTEARGHDGRADATAHLVIHALSHSLARCGRGDDVVHLRRRRRRRSQAGVAPHPARGIPRVTGHPVHIRPM